MLIMERIKRQLRTFMENILYMEVAVILWAMPTAIYAKQGNNIRKKRYY